MKWVLLFLLVVNLSLSADSARIQELEMKLSAAQDSEKAAILNELSELYLRVDPARALEYAQTVESLLLKYPSEKMELSVLVRICQASLYLGKYDQALGYGEKSLALSRRQNNVKATGLILNTMANVYNQKGDFPRSRESAYQAADIFRQLGEKRALAAVLNSIGISFDMQGNYEKALDYYLQSLKLKEELGDKEMIARSLNNVGVIYKLLGNTNVARDYYSRALKLKEELGDRSGIASQYINLGNLFEDDQNRAEPLDYYQKALVIYRELDDQSGIASALFNLGFLETRTGDLRLALDYFRQSLTLRQKMGEKEGMAQTHIELGKVYMRLNLTRQAVTALENGLVLAREVGALVHVQGAAQSLSALFEARRNYPEALRYHKEFKQAADDLFNLESSKKIAGVVARFENEKQEQEILLLKKNNEIQQLRLNRQRIMRNLMLGAIGLLVGGILLAVYRYRYIFTFWKKKNYIGHYRIIEPMGSGGMGTVYRAADVVDSSHRTIAVKVLREEFFADEVQIRRFKQEASLIDSVVHPHIVRVIERGETDGGLYIAMEALEGPTLAEFLQSGDRVPLPTALSIMRQIADALKSIHAMNIIHRDLKPDNIKLVDREGDPHYVKLLDFGLAMSQNMSRLTETGIVVGTIFYLSPEQISGAPISTACDIHSLGVIFYEMLAGVKPFIGENALEIMKQIMVSEPLEMGLFCPDSDRMLREMIMLMLRKDPRQRPSAAMVYDLVSGLEGQLLKNG